MGIEASIIQCWRIKCDGICKSLTNTKYILNTKQIRKKFSKVSRELVIYSGEHFHLQLNCELSGRQAITDLMYLYLMCFIYLI